MTAGFALIHGGGRGSWLWEPLLPHLRWPAAAIDLPGRGRHPADIEAVTLDDCVDAVLADIDAAGLDDLVVVAQAYMGVLGPELAARAPERVRHVVLLGAAVPPEGTKLFRSMPPWMVESKADPAHPRLVDRAVARDRLCNDMTDEQASWFLARLCPEMPTLGRLSFSRADVPPATPITYVKLLRDRAFTAAEQDEQVRNLERPVDVLAIDAGNNPMLTQPGALATILNGLAAGTGGFWPPQEGRR